MDHFLKNSRLPYYQIFLLPRGLRFILNEWFQNFLTSDQDMRTSFRAWLRRFSFEGLSSSKLWPSFSTLYLLRSSLMRKVKIQHKIKHVIIEIFAYFAPVSCPSIPPSLTLNYKNEKIWNMKLAIFSSITIRIRYPINKIILDSYQFISSTFLLIKSGTEVKFSAFYFQVNMK